VGIFRNKYRDKSDETLMTILSDGKKGAFDELYSRYSETLFHFFYKMLFQDEDLAADFCQNLFLKVFEKASSYNTEYKFSTWIYAIASNMCKNEYRRISRNKPAIPLEKAKKKIEPQAPIRLDSDIFKSHLQTAINKLDDKHRLCFVLRYQENKSISEISDLLDCPQGTVKSRLHNTLKKLSQELHYFDPKKKIIGYE